MSGVPAYPGCVVASSVVGCMTVGRPDVGAIVCTPEPGMAKTMVSGPAFALASRIAWRSEPAPESFVVVTVNVAAGAPAAAAMTIAASASENLGMEPLLNSSAGKREGMGQTDPQPYKWLVFSDFLTCREQLSRLPEPRCLTKTPVRRPRAR